MTPFTFNGTIDSGTFPSLNNLSQSRNRREPCPGSLLSRAALKDCSPDSVDPPSVRKQITYLRLRNPAGAISPWLQIAERQHEIGSP